MAKNVTSETKVAKAAMAEMNVFTAEQVELFEKYTLEIGNSMRTADHAQIRVGGLLSKIFDDELYKVRGYSSILEYAQNEFMFEGSKGSLSDMMLTFKAFGNKDTLEVKEGFENFTFSQLKLMRKLKPEDLTNVELSTTTRQLAEIIKGYKALPKKEEPTAEATAEAEAETTESTNVSRETKVEDSGHVEPYVEVTYGIGEFMDIDADALKEMIIEYFKSGKNVHLNFRYE